MSTTDTTDREQPLYRDKDWLEVQIVEKERTQQDIGDQCGVDQSTISTWKDKFGIKENEGPRLWRYPSVLRELYHEQNLSQREIADKLGCCHKSVGDQMKKHGIEADTPNQERPPYLHIHESGYWKWRCRIDYEWHHVLEHRLLAVAEYGFDKVSQNVVHHRNHHSVDNRPENLELMTRSEHTSYHKTHPGFGHLETHQEQDQ